MSSLLAFLHHVAAFALVATLVVEFVLLRGDLDTRAARRLQLTDMLFGVSSGVVLILRCAALMARGGRPVRLMRG